MNRDHVILVDRADRETGVAEKISAHRDNGLLHRAVSAFVFDDIGQLLLQRRALSKYHFPGLWANTCCGHPRPEEATRDAALRRMREELAIEVPIHELFAFEYTARDTHSGLAEWELDHVFVGTGVCTPCPEPAEVGEWKWMDWRHLLHEVESEVFAPWLRIAVRWMQAFDFDPSAVASAKMRPR